MDTAAVLLWLVESVVSADRLPVSAEDLRDWLTYREAKAEHDCNPITFTHEEVKKLLALEQENVASDVDEEDLFYSPKKT